jgi:5'-3' exoribonuclease 1
VLENWQVLFAQYHLVFPSMPNNFSAREHVFIGTLTDDPHLTVTWNEFDNNDQNIVTW